MKLFGFLQIIFERQGPEKATFLFLLSLNLKMTILIVKSKTTKRKLGRVYSLNRLLTLPGVVWHADLSINDCQHTYMQFHTEQERSHQLLQDKRYFPTVEIM
jgi:hypothetical protein